MTRLKIGACLTSDQIAAHRDWLFEAGRDIELQDLLSPDLVPDDWVARMAEAKTMLQGHTGRVGIHGPFEGLDIDNTDAELRPLITTRMIRALEACERLGGTHMVLHSPYTRWYANNRLSRAGYERAVIDRVHALLDPVVARAEAAGIVLVLENIEDVEPSTRRVLVEDFGSDAFALSIDTGHAQLAHRTAGAPPVDFFVRDAGDRLAHVHIQDVDGTADRHWAPGDGEIPWLAVFTALAECESNPRLMLEMADHTDIARGFAWLRDRGLAV
jgi:sugar phosphate isomerase/epimerase